MNRRNIACVLLVLLVLLCLAGCRETLDDIVRTKPSFRGTVISVSGHVALLEADFGESYSGLMRAYIGLDEVVEGSLTEVQVGDRVVVYYDGRAKESSPLQIPTVYAVLPWEE